MVKLRRKGQLAGLLVVGLLASGAGAGERRSEGRLDWTSGPVVIQSPGQKLPGPAQAGATIYAEDRLAAGPGASTELTLNDGSRLTLQPSSQIQVLDSRANAAHAGAVLLIAGWLQAQTPAGPGLEVQTAVAIARAAGARLTVAAAVDGVSRIAAEEGKVEVWGHYQRLTLAAGQQLTVTPVEHHLEADAKIEGNWAEFLDRRSQRLVRHAGRAARDLDGNLEPHVRHAENTRRTMPLQFQQAQAAARNAEGAQGRPEAYAPARQALLTELKLSYAQLRHLQTKDGFLVCGGELLGQLLRETVEQPAKYPPGEAKQVQKLQYRILKRDVAGQHQANQSALQDYAARLETLAVRHGLEKELGRPGARGNATPGKEISEAAPAPARVPVN